MNSKLGSYGCKTKTVLLEFPHLKDQLKMIHKQSYYGKHIVSRSQYVVKKAEGCIFSVAADSIEKIKYKSIHVPV